MSNKMDQSEIGKEDVSIDVDKLAKSLKGNIDTLIPLSENCCIYRVLPNIRMLNETLYTPKIVSIGPLHHGREELKAMQEHKLRYLEEFQKRTSVPMEEFLTLIKGKEKELRNCYAETINFGSEDFVKMVFLDAVFLIEIFLRCNKEVCPELIPDRIFTKPGMIMDIVLDIMLLENQLPIFILVDLFTSAKLDFTRKSLRQLAKYFFKEYVCQDVSIDERLFEPSNFSTVKHFVDLLISCLTLPNRYGTERPDASGVVPNAPGDASGVVPNAPGDASGVVPNVTKLHHAGVKFKLAPPTTNLLDIKFDKHKGTLEIPKLTIGNMTEHLLRNLHIFERLHGATNYLNDYVVILSRLLNTSKDVELLIHFGVIDNRILDSEGVSTLFQQLSKNARVKNTNFHYLGLVKDLQSYCKSLCHKWKANLMQKYFNTPWASISVIAAGILLILTFIQTVYSVKGSVKGPP